MLDGGGEENRFHIRIQLFVCVSDVFLILEIHRVANAANDVIRAQFFTQIYCKILIVNHFYLRFIFEAAMNPLFFFLQREKRLFGGIHPNCHINLVEKRQC